MIDSLREFWYYCTGNSKLAAIWALCGIAVILVLVVGLLFRAFHARQRWVGFAVACMMVATLIVSVLTVCPIRTLTCEVPYEYSEYLSAEVRGTAFTASYGGLSYDTLIADGQKVTAWVGASGSTLCICMYWDNDCITRNEVSGQISYIRSNSTWRSMKFIKVTTSGVVESEYYDSMTNFATSLSTYWHTNSPIYDASTATRVVIPADVTTR